MRIIIRNNYHHTDTIVETERPLTRRKIRDIRRRLCSNPTCRCCDELGGRGAQDDATEYAAFLDRAICVICTHRSEKGGAA